MHFSRKFSSFSGNFNQDEWHLWMQHMGRKDLAWKGIFQGIPILQCFQNTLYFSSFAFIINKSIKILFSSNIQNTFYIKKNRIRQDDDLCTTIIKSMGAVVPPIKTPKKIISARSSFSFGTSHL